MAHLPPCTVAMEACGSANHRARLFRTCGHEVRLIAPQFVKPFVQSNKNDAADAQAVALLIRKNLQPGSRPEPAVGAH